MVGFRSVQWAVTALLLFTVATCLGIVNGQLLAGVDDDRIEMVTASTNDVWKEEAGSTAAAIGDLHPFCAFCKTAVNDFQVQINRPDAVDVAVQSFEQFVCGKLQAEGIREKCKEVGEIYIPALIDVLREDVTEDKVCGALKLCDEDDNDDYHHSSFSLSPIFTSPDDHHHHPHPHPHHHHHHHHHLHHLFQLFSRHHPQRKCKICEAFAAQALRYLSQNETVEEIVAIAHKACKRLKGETTQEECDSLVDVYSEDLPSLMASVTPEELCHFVKFCDADVNDVAAHDEEVAGAAEREGGSGEEEEEDVNAFGRHGGNECLLCRFAVIKARKRLENPEVQEMIMGVLDRTCERVPKHTDQCKAFLESYGENFFENLDVILDPHGFCRRVGACFSSPM